MVHKKFITYKKAMTVNSKLPKILDFRPNYLCDFHLSTVYADCFNKMTPMHSDTYLLQLHRFAELSKVLGFRPNYLCDFHLSICWLFSTKWHLCSDPYLSVVTQLRHLQSCVRGGPTTPSQTCGPSAASCTSSAPASGHSRYRKTHLYSVETWKPWFFQSL